LATTHNYSGRGRKKEKERKQFNFENHPSRRQRRLGTKSLGIYIYASKPKSNSILNKTAIFLW
jgi:hypothetical protein